MKTATKPEYLYIETEDTRLTVIGTMKPAEAGHVWICNPAGCPVFKVARRYVTRSSREETVKRLVADREQALAARRMAARSALN